MKHALIIVAAVLAGTAAQAQNASVEAAWSAEVVRFANTGAMVERYCYPKTGSCTRSMTMHWQDGSISKLIGLETPHGNPRFERRVLCKFNEVGDSRVCLVFETGAVFQQVLTVRKNKWGPEWGPEIPVRR